MESTFCFNRTRFLARRLRNQWRLRWMTNQQASNTTTETRSQSAIDDTHPNLEAA
jgi:hypothetical protein